MFFQIGNQVARVSMQRILTTSGGPHLMTLTMTLPSASPSATAPPAHASASPSPTWLGTCDHILCERQTASLSLKSGR